MSIKNIIVDNGGVLSDPKTGYWFLTPNFWNIIKLDDVSVDSLRIAMKKNISMLTQEPKTELEEYYMFSDFYYQIVKDINYKDLSVDIANALAWDCVYNDDKYMFYDDVDIELDRYSKKYDLYIITDAWPSSSRVFNNRDISKYFKNIMISSLESKSKVEGLFEIFLKKNTNIIPEESIFIDDREENLEKAKHCGFHVLLMDRNYKYTDSEYIIIHKLSDIEEMIDSFKMR